MRQRQRRRCEVCLRRRAAADRRSARCGCRSECKGRRQSPDADRSRGRPRDESAGWLPTHCRPGPSRDGDGFVQTRQNAGIGRIAAKVRVRAAARAVSVSDPPETSVRLAVPSPGLFRRARYRNRAETARVPRSRARHLAPAHVPRMLWADRPSDWAGSNASGSCFGRSGTRSVGRTSEAAGRCCANPAAPRDVRGGAGRWCASVCQDASPRGCNSPGVGAHICDRAGPCAGRLMAGQCVSPQLEAVTTAARIRPGGARRPGRGNLRRPGPDECPPGIVPDPMRRSPGAGSRHGRGARPRPSMV